MCPWIALCLLLGGARVAAAQKEAVPSDPPPVVVPPQLKVFVHAEYPVGAVEEGVEAAVGMLGVVDGTGAVREVVVDVRAGPEFDAAALAAVKQFEFEPAMMDGQPIPVRIGYTYRFKLEKKAVKKEAGQVVSGVVKEKGVGVPGVGAEVALAGRARVTTDKKGRFSFRKIEPGTYRLVITSAEYKRFEEGVVVVEGKTLEAKFLLEPLVESPYEVVVKGKKEEAVVTR